MSPSESPAIFCKKGVSVKIKDHEKEMVGFQLGLSPKKKLGRGWRRKLALSTVCCHFFYTGMHKCTEARAARPRKPKEARARQHVRSPGPEARCEAPHAKPSREAARAGRFWCRPALHFQLARETQAQRSARIIRWASARREASTGPCSPDPLMLSESITTPAAT